MKTANTAPRLTPYVEQLAENEYARENLRKGAESLRAAYEQLAEGTTAFATGRQRPKRKWPKRLAVVGALGAAAVGVSRAIGGGGGEES
jgi:ferric-dicitrate binding protein FerR (iron transport regulator)